MCVEGIVTTNELCLDLCFITKKSHYLYVIVIKISKEAMQTTKTKTKAKSVLLLFTNILTTCSRTIPEPFNLVV